MEACFKCGVSKERVEKDLVNSSGKYVFSQRKPIFSFYYLLVLNMVNFWLVFLNLFDLLFLSGAYILWSSRIHDWGTNRPDRTGASNRKIHVAPQSSMGQHNSTGNKSKTIIFRCIQLKLLNIWFFFCGFVLVFFFYLPLKLGKLSWNELK